jgi:ABC-2 type transport system permease protein
MHASIVVGRRVLIELSRNRRLLFFWTLFPALMLLLFGWVYADERGSLGESFTWTAPGILLGAAMFFSCLAGPVVILVAERERQTLRRLQLTPLTGSAYFLGILWAHLLIAAGQAGLVYAITYLAGGSFRGPVLLGAGIVALSTAAYVGLGFTFGTRLARRTEDATGAVAAVGVPLLVLGGTFFSPGMLPEALEVAAWLDPVYHMNEAFRAVARGTPGPAFRWHLLFLGLFAPLALLLGAHSYRRVARSEGTG